MNKGNVVKTDEIAELFWQYKAIRQILRFRLVEL